MRDVEKTYALSAEPWQATLIPQFVHIGQVESPEPWSFREHLHKEYDCLLVRQGRVGYAINHSQFVARKGDVYFVQPGQAHEEQTLSRSVHFYFLKFRLRDQAGLDVPLVPGGKEHEQRLRDTDGAFRVFFEEVFQEVWHEKPGSLDVIHALILQVVWLLCRRLGLVPVPHATARHGSRRDTVLLQAKDYMRQKVPRTPSLDELGKYCSVSPDHLWHIFKEEESLTPHEYSLKLRLLEAQRLLKESDLAVYQIADRLGYRAASYFSRQFKKETGLSPQAFRSRAGGATDS